MSIPELLLILVVAVIVFGPSKLSMLASHLGLFIKKFDQIKAQVDSYWHQQQMTFHLKENEQKAKHADQYYQNKQRD